MKGVQLAAIAMLAGSAAGESKAPACRTFEQIYGNGKNLCNRMWGEAFVYVPKTDPNYDLAYTWWHFEDANPNTAVTKKRIDLGLQAYNETGVCHLQYYHHDKPIPGQGLSECHPFESDACCSKDTVESVDVLKEAYGPEFHWDRCGPLSQECERFFVHEACFYECDPNAGMFRKFHPHKYDSYMDPNEWELFGLPVKGEYCDAFYRACKDQLFCAEDDGDAFSCALVYERHDRLLSPGAIAVIVILSVLVVAASVCLCRIVMRERAGSPIFAPMDPEDFKQTEMNSQSSNSMAQT